MRLELLAVGVAGEVLANLDGELDFLVDHIFHCDENSRFYTVYCGPSNGIEDEINTIGQLRQCGGITWIVVQLSLVWQPGCHRSDLLSVVPPYRPVRSTTVVQQLLFSDELRRVQHFVGERVVNEGCFVGENFHLPIVRK